MYEKLLNSLSKKVECYFSEIEATHGFDYGVEFEIALCKILRDLLPNKFGICRGFIVASNGLMAGDDIIVYDRQRFPTIRMLGESFIQKEYVPFEAVYCYIEAKHNLELDHDEETTLSKALEQISKIKALKREDRKFSQITENISLSEELVVDTPNKSWPDTWNPLYTCIISRKTSLLKTCKKTKYKKGDLDGESTYHLLERPMLAANIPDLLVAGDKIICLPTYDERKHLMPFNKPNNGSGFCILRSKHNALALGLCQMLWALDRIELGTMPWENIIVNGIEESSPRTPLPPPAC